MKNVKYIIACGFLILSISSQICGAEKKEITHNAQYHELGMRLITGVKNNNTHEINQALAAGANINYQTQDTGETAFHIAMFDYPEILMFLIKTGIDMDIQNKNGRTAVEELDLIEDEYLTYNFKLK